ncbi:MAG: YdiU family protein [Planctomycetes bacterium]|nr:YdiU family protein [Planctomycetota bacterium]
MEAAGWRLDSSYARLPEPLFAASAPTPVRTPRLVVLNARLAAELGLDAAALRVDGADIFAGNSLPPGSEPIAQAYAGHQFGHFTTLGDGRAILLGEQVTSQGHRIDIQLKGAGRTRYSRGGDGRAALGPMLREYVISEGMHALGIPTTRSLAVATTGEVVMRTAPLPGAVLTRVATSHIRVGTFELAAALGRRDVLRALLDHAVARHDPELASSDPADLPVAFLEAVIERQASLVARWMLVGFVHGVMNTDNMTVSGETIDFGPCAFLDAYDPAAVFSSIDQHGRYAYGKQPSIAHWNLARLAESLLPLVPGDAEAAVERLQAVLATFPGRFARHHVAGARGKLGFAAEETEDAELFAALLAAMHEAGGDFTATFATLVDLVPDIPAASAVARRPACGPSVHVPADWRQAWRERLKREAADPGEVATRLRRANPNVIPRNHRVEESLAAAEGGDFGPLERLLAAVGDPAAESPSSQPYRAGPPAGSGPYRTFCGT